MMTALPMGPYGVLLIMLLIVFIMGCFLDSLAIIMITLPIMMPVAVQLGFDPLWFALLFSLDVIIGMLTPPFGYALFYFKGLGHPDVSMMDIYNSAWIFVLMMVMCLGLCIVFPQIALWLPNQMIR
jgi:TRAP-type mannitol/chloroaromatic compound transport system permease large subunit